MKPTTKGLRDLFPKSKPYSSGYLKVSKLHMIHFEEYGNPRGTPLVFLHGGPGGGIEPLPPLLRSEEVAHRPARSARVGKNTFRSSRENTTHRGGQLREHLGIDRWVRRS
jgi:proline iminopeptidase